MFASLLAVCAICALLLNYIGAHLTFFGEPVILDTEDVRNYWICVSALVLGVGVSFAAALRGATTYGWFWHLLVAITGLVAALAFAVTETGPPRSPEPPEPPRGGPVCHSGGDSDECVGG